MIQLRYRDHCGFASRDASQYHVSISARIVRGKVSYCGLVLCGGHKRCGLVCSSARWNAGCGLHASTCFISMGCSDVSMRQFLCSLVELCELFNSWPRGAYKIRRSHLLPTIRENTVNVSIYFRGGTNYTNASRLAKQRLDK